MGVNRGMRYIELLEHEFLRETRTFEVPSSRGEIRIWENPSSDAIGALQGRLGDLRGMSFDDGSYWVWEAYVATHHDVRKSRPKADPLPTATHFVISGPTLKDKGWSVGTWEYSAPAHDKLLWIDRSAPPPRLRDMFPILVREPEKH